MRNIIKTEFLKLKRYSVIKAGIIMTTLSPLLSLFYSTANGGPTWTFDYFMQQVMISNCTLFFPIIIALIAGYIITREYTDDTMKNILTIPIPYKQLLSGKLLILLLLTISFSQYYCRISGSSFWQSTQYVYSCYWGEYRNLYFSLADYSDILLFGK